MVRSEAQGAVTSSLFDAEQGFEIEIPPSPFAEDVERSGRPVLQPADSPEPVKRGLADRAELGREAVSEPSQERRAWSSPAGSLMRSASADQEWNPRLLLSQLRRLARLDEAVFSEVQADASQTLSAGLVVFGAIVAAAIGGGLWLIVEGDGLRSGNIVLRESFLGAIAMAALWGVWLIVVRLLLVRAFGRSAEAGSLFRPMAFATVPLAGQVLMFVPPIAFGVGVVTLMAWFALSVAATEAAVPGATRKEIVVANGMGFSILAIGLSILADAAAIAPGIFARGADLSHLV